MFCHLFVNILIYLLFFLCWGKIIMFSHLNFEFYTIGGSMINLYTPNELRTKLEDANLRRIAIKVGLNPATLYRFMNEPRKQVLFNTIKVLSEFFIENDKLNSEST